MGSEGGWPIFVWDLLGCVAMYSDECGKATTGRPGSRRFMEEGEAPQAEEEQPRGKPKLSMALG